MIAYPGTYVNPQPHTFGLTATERCELVNWAIFDALPAVVPFEAFGPRYRASVEFEPTDPHEMFVRMRRVLEDIPLGQPVEIESSVRLSLNTDTLNNCWFSERLANQFFSMGPQGAPTCYLRARYIFLSHWFQVALNEGLEHAEWTIEKIGKEGLIKRYALQDVPFKGKGSQ